MNTHQTEIFHRLIAIVSQNQTLANISEGTMLIIWFQHVRTTPDWPGILQFLPHHLPDIIVSDQLPTFDAQQLQKIRDAQKRCYTVLPLFCMPFRTRLRKQRFLMESESWLLCMDETNNTFVRSDSS
jgi:hypothetical protein